MYIIYVSIILDLVGLICSQNVVARFMSPVKNKSIGHFMPGQEGPGWLMWEATLVWKRMLDQRLEQYDLTNYQLMILNALVQISEKNEVVNQAELAEFLRTNVMMTSNVLRTLEAKKLISRQSHPEDTRAKIIVLTSEGEDLAKKGHKEILSLNEEIFGTDKNLTQELTKNLEALLNIIT
jgi:DNA-binding MarR family transcriptional regulator